MTSSRPRRRRALERRTSAQTSATIAARAILNKARSLGIAVGTDGDELLALMPARLPSSTRRWFEHWIGQFKDEIVAIIQRENAHKQNAEVM